MHLDAKDLLRHQSESQSSNPFQLALDAAELGTWDWDTDSGRVAWSARTYQLWGIEPGALATSHDLFLRTVFDADRPAVKGWCNTALAIGRRASVEYRIVRADRTVRWMRSIGRVIKEGPDHAMHFVGIVDDVTEEKESRESPLLERPSLTSLSVHQVARILGVGATTVKRIATAQHMESLRSSRKDSRRFAPEHVLNYLRGHAGPRGDLTAAAGAQDMSACLVLLMQELVAGRGIDELLDDEVSRAAKEADGRFIAELLSRIPFMIPERPRTVFPVLVAGGTARPEAELTRCLLRAHGHEVLSLANDDRSAGIAEVANSIRARVLVLFPGGRAQLSAALSIAEKTARNPRTAAVCVWSQVEFAGGPKVSRVSSMRDLSSVLSSL